MKRPLFFALLAYYISILCGSNALAADAEGWEPLLDEKLSKWEIFLGVPHESVTVPGYTPELDESGKNRKPLGTGYKHLNIYTVSMVDGEPVLHISGEIFGGLTSLEEYESYHLSLQFRWGEKKWPPRLNKKRDSGILFHCVGEHGAFWDVWMRSLECQVQEGDCGDYIPLAGSGASVPVRIEHENARPVYDPTKPLGTYGYISHGPSEEMPHGEWNTIEIFTIGRTAIYVINGTPNMAIYDTWEKSPEGNIPLTRGKLQIQSEAAEIDYRRIKIRPIDSFPEELKAIAKRPAE